MDNELMARQLRPPSEPSRSSTAPFIPPPTPAPWDPKPAPWLATQTPAPNAALPWDAPVATPPPQMPEPEPQAQHDEWPQVDLVPSVEPAAPPSSTVEAEMAPVAAPQPFVDTSAVPGTPQPDEEPWDRPAEVEQSTDATADGPRWDAPPPFVIDDEPTFFDDRPPDMLAAFDEPGSVAPAAAVAEPSEPVASEDPYDADAPVVPEVAHQAIPPAWPNWNGHVSSVRTGWSFDQSDSSDPQAIPSQTPAPWETEPFEAEAVEPGPSESAELEQVEQPTVGHEGWASADPEQEAATEPEEATVVENTDEAFDWDVPPGAAAVTPPTQVLATVPINTAALINGPAVFTAGPESGLPANLVLRIELAMVDEPRESVATAEPAEVAPPLSGSLDDAEAWWISPATPTESAAPTATPALATDYLAAQPAADPWAPPTEPVTPQAPMGPATRTPVASDLPWPPEPTQEDASEWPHVWEAPSPAPPAPPAQPAPAAPSSIGSSEFAAPAEWPAAARPSSPALRPLAPEPRVSTIEAPQNDLWFLAEEPASGNDEAASAASGEAAAAQPRSSLVTAGLTVGMAVVVVVLVLIFVQLMTSLLR